MRKPAYWAVVEKSRAACVAAVETYNRASCEYREENFAILMINAWELLLKARIMQENGGKAAVLYEKCAKKKLDGTPSKKKAVKLTRSGLPYTIGLDRAYSIVSMYAKNRVDEACIKNIEAMLEIRDSATHFAVKHPNLSKMLTEISLAAVRNYVMATQKWFGVSFSDLNIASIPMSFDLDAHGVEAVAKKASAAVTKFLAHMQKMETASAVVASDYTFRVKVEFDIVKKKADGAVTAHIVGLQDKADITVVIDGDGNSLPAGFEWGHNQLTRHLAKRYTNFKQNGEYYKILKELQSELRLCIVRQLNPLNPKSSTTKFYNPYIVKRFDAHYTLKE